MQPLNPAAPAGSVAQWHPGWPRVRCVEKQKRQPVLQVAEVGQVFLLALYNRNQPPLPPASKRGSSSFGAVKCGLAVEVAVSHHDAIGLTPLGSL